MSADRNPDAIVGSAPVHAAGVSVAVAAGTAFAFLADPVHLASWAKGLVGQRVVAPLLVRGRLVHESTPTWCRIEPAPAQRIVTYRLGADPDTLQPRIVAHVMDGAVLGGDAGGCVITLLAWRTAGMSDARWASLCAGHEAEVQTVRALLERR
ncbi:MAG: hypothetical protein R3E87_22000 [Burkholderiaceae bacterium]